MTARRVIVVDDDDANRYAKARHLQVAGYAVLEARDGPAALAVACAHPDATVVLDIQMPGMNGYEVCRRLREDPATARMSIVATSATFVKDADRVKGLEAGADVYLTEPLEATVIVASVRALERMRHAEHVARDAAAQWQATFHAIRDGLCVVEADGTLRLANEALASLLGTTRSALEGMPVDAAFSHCETGAKGHLATRVREGVALDLACGDRRLHLTAWPVATPAGPPSSVCVVSDVTLQRAVEEERARALALQQAAREKAEETNRIKDEFLATLSHELRTPLSSIVGWTRILRDQPPSEAQLRRGLEVIDRNVDVQKQLIEELLDVSRIIAGKLTLRQEVVDMADLVRGAVDAMRPSAAARQVALRHDAAEAVCVRGDRERLLQVVTNLLSNAVKFTPGGGSVTVSVAALDDSVLIEVADTGQGIDEQFLPHVFERFRQADSSTTRTHGGLGLGLAIVWHLVEMHGGSVSAASGGRGSGATFRIVLPRLADGEAVPDVVPSSPSESRLDGVRVLVVEDDPDGRELLSVMLGNHGADVVAAGSAAEALASFEARPPDVVVSDISMPTMDGYALVRALRSRGSRVPALALTAHAREQDRELALEAGFDDHLGKPVVPAQLVAGIRRALGSS